MAHLHGRAGRLTAETGGFRPGQEHSNDNLAGIGETNMIFYPGTNDDGYGGLHDCCPPTSGWQIEGFVCEHYAAPGTFMIGLNRVYADAYAFCASEYNGDLASIHSQADYDRVVAMTTGYTQPVLIGGKSDTAGNWAWTDGSFFDKDFITAHCPPRPRTLETPLAFAIANRASTAVFYACVAA
jgi:hypothetical protein